MDSQEVLQLRDIHLPGAPDFWPPALGWWLLFSIIFFVSFWALLKTKKYKQSKKQHQVLFNRVTELEDQLRKDLSNETLAEFNILLRQLAVTYYPRAEIASLTGGDWLHFLDQSGKTDEFSRGAGRILIDAPYQSGQLQNLNIDEFIPLIRGWVSKVTKEHLKQKSGNKMDADFKTAVSSEKPPKSRGVSFG